MGKLEGDLKRLGELRLRLQENYDLSQEIGPRRKPRPPTEPMEPRRAVDREGPTPLDVLISVVIREVEAQIQITRLRLEPPTRQDGTDVSRKKPAGPREEPKQKPQVRSLWERFGRRV